MNQSFLIALVLGTSGCTLVTEPWGYSEISLESELQALGSGCSSCLKTECAAAFEACSSNDECVNEAACRSAHPDPTSNELCGGNPAYTELTRCRSCYEACNIGAHWDCVGRYSRPTTGSKVHWVQRLVDNNSAGGRRPFAGVTVRACRHPARSCGPSFSAIPDPYVERDLVAWTETDQAGWFSFELEIEPGEDGFDGVLIASGAEIPVYRMQQSQPLVSGRHDTELASVETLNTILDLGQIPRFDPNYANVLFQVQDCFTQAARDVSVTPLSNDASLILYTEDMLGKLPNLRATTIDGGGTGAVLGLDASPPLVSLEFSHDSKVVNRAVVSLAANEISVVQVAPGASPWVDPW